MIKERYLSVRQSGTNKVELVPNLTLQDRCDSCGAEAKSVVLLSTGAVGQNILLFCGHHTNKFEAALIGKGATIYRKEEQ